MDWNLKKPEVIFHEKETRAVFLKDLSYRNFDPIHFTGKLQDSCSIAVSASSLNFH